MERLILCAVVVLCGVGQATATIIVQDIEIDLSDGHFHNYRDTEDRWGRAWGINVSVPTFTIAAGDTYLAKVRFSNQKALELGTGEYLNGMELSKAQLAFESPSYVNWMLVPAFDFIGVSGQLLTDPLTVDYVTGGGGSYSTSPITRNLTDQAFAFSGVDVSMYFSEHTLNTGDGIINRLSLEFSAETVRIVDDPAPIPEPTSIIIWSVIGLTFGSAVHWRRRKTTGSR